MLAALVEPIVAALIKELVAYWKTQKGENAIRKAEAYERALQAWKEVETVRAEFVPLDVFRVRDGTARSGGVPDPGGTAPRPD